MNMNANNETKASRIKTILTHIDNNNLFTFEDGEFPLIRCKLIKETFELYYNACENIENCRCNCNGCDEQCKGFTPFSYFDLPKYDFYNMIVSLDYWLNNMKNRVQQFEENCKKLNIEM